MIKLLLGGSPCTYWSIAQKNGRETEAEGMGWELFKNYLIAKEKFKPDYFLYENNKSAAKAIKEQIKKELNVWDGTLYEPDTGARYIEINSALVSAQNRQRFYVHNCGEVEQPQDRGILLRDILESSSNPVNITNDEKSQTLKAQYAKNSAANFCCYSSTYGASGVAEPVGTTKGEKSYALTAYYSTGQNAPHTLEKHKGSMAAEPVAVTPQGKSFCLTANYEGAHMPHSILKSVRSMAAEPVRVPQYGKK